ncbi:hypothetical protein GARC_3208 [Paraglaciecola arctica BSs20135]|uniref:Uncharacterized protein n=1 Tax=Paraglaciecola arctica BSs20135 TaxID=493475 RepID=K6YPR4_9ALTE|nr:hypothetical protein GARC_3208 [Paraglaciecola arctica BSs20135]
MALMDQMKVRQALFIIAIIKQYFNKSALNSDQNCEFE